MVEFFCIPNTSSWGLSKGLTLLTRINRTLCGKYMPNSTIVRGMIKFSFCSDSLWQMYHCGGIEIFKTICAHWRWQLTIDKGNKPRRITHCGLEMSRGHTEHIWQWGAIGGLFSAPESDCNLQTLKHEARAKLYNEMVEMQTFCTKVLNPMNKCCRLRPWPSSPFSAASSLTIPCSANSMSHLWELEPREIIEQQQAILGLWFRHQEGTKADSMRIRTNL